MADNKSAQIYTAAIQIFSEKGFQRASMDEIATASGVAKGTLYYYFKSKNDLFIKLVEKGITELNDLIISKIRKVSSPQEKISVLIEYHVRYLWDNENFCKILLTEVWGNEKRHQHFRHSLGKYIKVIESVLEEGKKQGVFDYEDRETAAAGVFGSISIASLYWLLRGEAFPPATVVSTMTKLITCGLGFHYDSPGLSDS